MLYKQSIRNSSIDLSTFTDHKKLGCAVDYRQKVMGGGGGDCHFKSTWTKNFQTFKLVLEKAEEPEIKLPTSTGS